MKGFINIIFVLVTSCITTKPDDTSFSTFPKIFTANQIVKIIDQKTSSEQVIIASLSRDNEDYVVTFLHPAFQISLLRVERKNGVDSIKYFVDKSHLKFDPIELIDTIAEVYRGPKENSVSANSAQISYSGKRFSFLLKNFKEFNHCVFPETIELMPKAEGAPKLLVISEDIECKKT